METVDIWSVTSTLVAYHKYLQCHMNSHLKTTMQQYVYQHITILFYHFPLMWELRILRFHGKTT
uniref:Uncharacterized protein n=1 Tax=Anguilla anguilla TaxID=7936 RepID=A0A0E9Q1I8_ANGAN